MAIGIAAASLIGAGLHAANTIGTNIANIFANKAEAQRQRDFNATEAEKNRNFQKEMRDTALISSVEQAKKLGISPSLVLGQGSTSLGGSQASASQTHHNLSGISNAVTGVLSMLEKEEQLKAMQEMNEDRLQAQKDMYHEKLEYLQTINNKNEKYPNERKYTEEELNKIFDNINDIKI